MKTATLSAHARETVLIIDDLEEDVRLLRQLLTDGTRDVAHSWGVQEALTLAHELEPDLILVSMELPDLPGPRVVRLLSERAPDVGIVALTARPNTADAVASIRAGAADYMSKPVDPARLEQACGRALREVRMARALASTQEEVLDRYGFRHLLSRSPRMMEVFDQIRAVAATDATVLVLGETGTGKELVARAVHDASKRREGRYVSANCGGFAEGLLESELFGHERGSFTGAVGRREGVFMMADGGTLFLDELGEVSVNVQVNLLRVLEEMSFRRVGGEKKVSVDVRIVAATHVDLEDAVRAGTFREDLYYRLNVFPIRLPPLRERREDIPLLMRHFLEGAASDYDLEPPQIAADALDWIINWRWPGNVRQLRALCERWVIIAHGRTLLKEMLPTELLRPGGSNAGPLNLALDEEQPLGPQLERVSGQLERAYLHRVLQAQGGHLQRTATVAGISRRTLYNKMRQFSMDPVDYRPT